ncbi:MAG: NAD-dependent epimerase/dehydratase family protein [Sporichthyaceae bacterium]
MTIVVTGAAGFLGRASVAALLAAGHEVIGIDRAAAAPQGAGHRQICADLLGADPAAHQALRGAAGIIHLAGCPGVRDPRADVTWHRHRDNVLAVAAVLAAAGARTPVVVATSSSVYGGSRQGRPSIETDALDPRGGYARSKADAEALCAAHNAAGGRVVIARPFTVAGEGQRADMALATWIAAARAGRPLRILGDPARTRDVTDVRQVARALGALLNAGVGGPVNIGTGVGISLAQLTTAVGVALGVRVEVRVEPASPDEVADTLADTARLRALTGLTLTTDLGELLTRQITTERRSLARSGEGA